MSDNWNAGQWVPAYYGSRYTVANKFDKTRFETPARTIAGHDYPSSSFMSEQDTSFIAATLAEANAECARRNEVRA